MKEFNKNINNKVLSSFAEALKIDPLDINIERNFAEYSNLDSLGFVKLIVSLNEKFNIELDTELVLECDNIRMLEYQNVRILECENI